MNYELSGQKRLNVDKEVTSTFSVSYSENEGLKPKGCVSLEITLIRGKYHVPEELIKILESLPRSIETLELPWRDNVISNDDYIKILCAVPTWVKSLSFRPNMDCKVLSSGDQEIMAYLPRSCHRLWDDAFNIIKPETLILLLEALPPWIIGLTLFQDKLKKYSEQKLLCTSKSISTNVKQLRIAKSSSVDEGISAKDMIRILKNIPPSIANLSCDYFRGYMSDTEKGYVRIEPDVDDAESVLKAIPSFVNCFELHLPLHLTTSAIVESQKRLLLAVPPTIMDLSINNFLECSDPDGQTHTHSLETLRLHLQTLSLTTEEEKTVSALTALPISVKKLCLNNAKRFSYPCLIGIILNLPQTIHELTINFGHGNNGISNEQLEYIISQIKPSVKKFKVIAFRGFFSNAQPIPVESLIKIYKAVPLTIEKCDLGKGCRFEIKAYNQSQRVKLLKSLPISFGKRLHLIGDDISEEDLINTLKNLPSFITTLSLNGMNICNNHKKESVSKIFKEIAKNIDLLDLRKNQLFKIGVDGITLAMQSLPSGITHLDLRDNYFQKKDFGNISLEASFKAFELKEILQSIPGHVTHIYMDYEDMQVIKALSEDDGIFDDLKLYYDFTNECFVRMEVYINKLSLISPGSISKDIFTQKIVPYLSFRDLTRVLQSSVIESPADSNTVKMRLKA